MLDEVLDAHRRDAHVAHLAPERSAEDDARTERVGDIGHRRIRELGRLRDEVDRMIGRADRGEDVVHRLGRHAVDDHAENDATLRREATERGADGRRRLLRLAAADDDEHRRAELVRKVGVEAEVERRCGAGEIGSFAEDEVAFGLERLVGGDDDLAQLVVGLGGARLLRRQRVRGRGVVARTHELELRIGLLRNDRTEEAEPLDPPREELHEAETDDRLPALRLHRGDVEIAGVHARDVVIGYERRKRRRDDGFRSPRSALSLRRARAPHRRGDDASPPRQAPPGLRRQREQGAGGDGVGAQLGRERAREPRRAARRHPDGRAQQRRRPREPQPLLGDHGARRRRRARRRTRRRDRRRRSAASTS